MEILEAARYSLSLEVDGRSGIPDKPRGKSHVIMNGIRPGSDYKCAFHLRALCFMIKVFLLWG